MIQDPPPGLNPAGAGATSIGAAPAASDETRDSSYYLSVLAREPGSGWWGGLRSSCPMPIAPWGVNGEMPMQSLKQLLERKGTDVWSIGPDATVLDGVRMMAEKGVGALLVMDGDRPVGVLSERDYARKVVLEGRSSDATPVREIMSRGVIYATPDQSVEECMALMTDRHVRHLPVIQSDAVLGIISIGDLVQVIIAEQKFVIQQLEHYISG
jgi:CBS domain-containing protein